MLTGVISVGQPGCGIIHVSLHGSQHHGQVPWLSGRLSVPGVISLGKWWLIFQKLKCLLSSNSKLASPVPPEAPSFHASGLSLCSGRSRGAGSSPFPGLPPSSSFCYSSLANWFLGRPGLSWGAQESFGLCARVASGSPTRDRVWAPHTGSSGLSHWAAREVPPSSSRPQPLHGGLSVAPTSGLEREEDLPRPLGTFLWFTQSCSPKPQMEGIALQQFSAWGCPQHASTRKVPSNVCSRARRPQHRCGPAQKPHRVGSESSSQTRVFLGSSSVHWERKKWLWKSVLGRTAHAELWGRPAALRAQGGWGLVGPPPGHRRWVRAPRFSETGPGPSGRLRSRPFGSGWSEWSGGDSWTLCLL